jgi:hypothetical protein
MIDERLILKNPEGCGHGLIEVQSQEILRKTQKILRIADIMADIQTNHLPGRSPERFWFISPLILWFLFGLLAMGLTVTGCGGP